MKLRLKAGAIIRRGSQVLLNRMDGTRFWTAPGGGAEPGEFTADALARELTEEIGLQAEIGRLLWVSENQWDWDGEFYHEVGFYYSARLLDPPYESEFRGAESHLLFRWFDPDAIEDFDVRPPPLKDLLKRSSDPVNIEYFRYPARDHVPL